MVWTEKGPFAMFERLRAALGRSQKHDGGLYDMVSCFYCLSVWISVIPALALAHNFVAFIGFVFVLSAEAIFLNQIFDNLS